MLQKNITRPLVLLSAVVACAALTACSSGKIRERKEQREKVASTSKHYCDFVNGEVFPDIEVALNLEIAKHCEPESAVSLTNYRSPSENVGIIYCCPTNSESVLATDGKADSKADAKGKNKNGK